MTEPIPTMAADQAEARSLLETAIQSTELTESEAAARELLETLLATNDLLLKRIAALESGMAAAAKSLEGAYSVLRAHETRLDEIRPEAQPAPGGIQ